MVGEVKDWLLDVLDGCFGHSLAYVLDGMLGDASLLAAFYGSSLERAMYLP